jgi:hypothetical protein
MEEKSYIDVDFDLGQSAIAEVKRGTSELMKILKDKIGELVWEISNSYIETHLENDVLANYDDAVRQEVIRLAHFWSRHKDDFYGKSLRKAIFDDHKEEILPLIKDETIEELQKEVKTLKKQIENFYELRRY